MRMGIRVWMAVAICSATISPALAGVADSPVSQPKPVMERVAIPAPYLSSLAPTNNAGTPGLVMGTLDGLCETETMLTSALPSAPRGKWLDLGTLGGASSVATSVNADGQVAGHAEVANGDVHAFRWDPSSRAMLDLGTLGGKWSYAQGINDRGDVVGYSEMANGDVHAFVWLADQRSMRDLGSLGGSHSRGDEYQQRRSRCRFLTDGGPSRPRVCMGRGDEPNDRPGYVGWLMQLCLSTSATKGWWSGTRRRRMER